MMYGDGNFPGGFFWPGLVSSVLFWVVVAIAIVALIRYLTRHDRPWGGPAFRPGPPPPFPPGPAAMTPEHILAERFARGEIDEQEFRSRMAALREHAQGPAPGPEPGPPPAS